jgi:hypothetical protein
MKNKTLATVIAALGGIFGLHRFYLYGFRDRLGGMLPIPGVLGLYGLYRAQHFGLDDPWSWVLIPLLGFTISGCALNAIVYGLMDKEKWNAKFNPGCPPDDASGQTNWLTIGAVVATLLVGTTVLMASLAFSFQRFFEFRADSALSLPTTEFIGRSVG